MRATDGAGAPIWRRRWPEGPELPGKFGFALDCGAAPVLRDTSADIRLERAGDGRLILRADGMPVGAPVSEPSGARAALALARWFVAAGGVTAGRGRMAALICARGSACRRSFALRSGPCTRPWPPGPGPGGARRAGGAEFRPDAGGNLLAALAGHGCCA
jgi:precorrin-3B synthase